MRILLFSDFHNAMDFNSLNSILSKLPAPDVVFTLGDISSSDLLSIKDLLPGVPVYGICGNHDGPASLELAPVTTYIVKFISIARKPLCQAIFIGFKTENVR